MLITHDTMKKHYFFTRNCDKRSQDMKLISRRKFICGMLSTVVC